MGGGPGTLTLKLGNTSKQVDTNGQIVFTATEVRDCHNHDNRYLQLTGGTIDGNLTINEENKLTLPVAIEWKSDHNFHLVLDSSNRGDFSFDLQKNGPYPSGSYWGLHGDGGHKTWTSMHDWIFHNYGGLDIQGGSIMHRSYVGAIVYNSSSTPNTMLNWAV